MNKEMKQYLDTVVESLIHEDSEAAKKAFHEYLRLKTQAILGEKESTEAGSGEEGSGEGSGEEGSGEEGSGEGSGTPAAKKDDKKDDE